MKIERGKWDEKESIKTFTSFSGADIVAKFNDKVVGEFQSLDWTMNFQEGIVNGTIICSFFDREPFNPKEVNEIVIAFMNEHGQKMEQVILGVKFLTMSSSYSIDMISTEIYYTFKAASLETYEGLTHYRNGL